MAKSLIAVGSRVQVINGTAYEVLKDPSHLDVELGANDTVRVVDKVAKTTIIDEVYSDYTSPTAASATLLAAAIVAVLDTASAAAIDLSTVEASLAAIDANTDQIEVKLDAGNISIANVDVNTDGLEALQTTANASLSSIDADTTTIASDTTSLDAKIPAQGAALTAASTPVNIASDQTVPVSAASLPLPTGAATETTLNDIKTNTSDNATETTLAALNTKVTAVDTTGKATEAKQDVGNTSLSTIAGDTTSIDGKIPAQGAALTAASTPVNIASDQTVPVSAASLPLPTGAATEATLSALNAKVTACDTGNVTIGSALPAGVNNIGDVDVATVPSDPFGANADAASTTGSISAKLRRLATDLNAIVSGSEAQVDVVGALPTGTNTIGGVTGNIAHDAVDSGNPNKIGAKAINHGTNPTAVAANDRTDLYANRHGVPWVIGGHPNVVPFEYMATSAQTNDAIVTVGSGTKIVLTRISATVDNATTVDVGVRIGFGTASVPTEPTDGNSVNGVVLSHPGIAPGSGIVEGTGAGIIGVGADNEDLRITSEVPTTGKLRITGSYYTIQG